MRLISCWRNITRSPVAGIGFPGGLAAMLAFRGRDLALGFSDLQSTWRLLSRVDHLGIGLATGSAVAVGGKEFWGIMFTS